MKYSDHATVERDFLKSSVAVGGHARFEVTAGAWTKYFHVEQDVSDVLKNSATAGTRSLQVART